MGGSLVYLAAISLSARASTVDLIFAVQLFLENVISSHKWAEKSGRDSAKLNRNM